MSLQPRNPAQRASNCGAGGYVMFTEGTGELQRLPGRMSAAIEPALGIGPGVGMAGAPVVEVG